MLFSILIPTLERRREQFQTLHEKLRKQINNVFCVGETELLYFLDHQEHSIGHKRNQLLRQAQGKFVAFIDDDDDVSDDYVWLICQAMREHPDIDCIGMKSLITFAGKHSHLFVHSLQYREYFKKGGIYYRPPYHLNPIKREIALRYPFEDISYSEDIDWAMRMSRDRALQKEYFIDEVIYFYHSQRSWFYQILVDSSETFRHAMGLQLVNRILVKRWLKSFFSQQKNRILF